MTTRHAIITPSFRGDLDRCKLLCASIDAFVSELSTHYLLVEDRDVLLFRPLEGPRRRIIAESQLFPSWLKSIPDPTSFGRRRIWTSPGALARGLAPLRGWHTQQLRKIAAPALIDEEVLLYADSDVIMLKPYRLSQQVGAEGLRLYRSDHAISESMGEHVEWLRRAAGTLRIPTPPRPAHDYINNLVTWDARHARAMTRHIEDGSGRHWIEAVASARGFSEWLLYGCYIDHVLGSASGHAATGQALARTYWYQGDVERSPLTPETVKLDPWQVAIGVQSFIGVPMEALWNLFKAFEREPQACVK
jgi:hypothetical protein